MTQEPLPLATIFREVLQFIGSREDAVVFGAHAVNAYCEPARMTADIDILSTRATDLAAEIQALLSRRFQIAARVREVNSGGFRIYQVRKPKNRHLVDVRQVSALPAFRQIEGVRIIEPADLAAMKAISIAARKGQEKGLSDTLDLHRLLRTFPELRSDQGRIPERLHALGAGADAFEAWRDVVRTPLDFDAADIDD